ncbi:MAG: endolytic transglycosylase MltG [Bdellovibrionales bacterium]|nr:endolytic transglycosylase MltG [Bdellovibrionales bacterium]
MKTNHILFLIGAPLFAVLLVAIKIYYSAYVWRYEGPNTYFYIKPSESFASINSRLAKEKLISSPRLFHRLSQWEGTMTKFKSGQYEIKANSTLLDVYNTFISGKSLAMYFTIPEGKNLYEIGKMLEDGGITPYAQFVELCKSPAFVQSLGINGSTVEGYLYPETYDFAPNLPADQVIKTMVREFKKKTADIDFANQKMSKEDIITLASMVEKETGDKSERPMIAGVFHNRLNINMRLQSDPTTIYGMFERYNGNITRKDLLTPSDYNTYTIKALPIGPIANPGIASIKAVIQPAQHKYLYFVSQNDGRHIFSETYGQHQEAVVKWQKTAKNREGKSWRNKTDDADLTAPVK